MLSEDNATLTDSGLCTAIPYTVIEPSVKVWIFSSFCKSIVKEILSLSVHEHHSESVCFKLPRTPLVKTGTPEAPRVNTGFAVALLYDKGNTRVFPICCPSAKVAHFKVCAVRNVSD